VTTPRDNDRTEALPTAPHDTVPGDMATRDTVPGDMATRDTVPGAARRDTGPQKLKPTRISGTWVAVLASIVVLIVLLVFILQNLTGATIHFMGTAGTLPLGVALLFAAIAGALVVALVGAARITQLRRQAKRGLR
jgi:uncharacterized integral membrane protein